MAQELGLEHSLSPLNKDREGPRADRAPKSWEMFRGFRSGFDPREIKAEVTGIFRESDNAADFVARLRQHGYQLTQGDRRDFCILDPAGEVHSLARRIDGVNAKELKVFMKDLDRSDFPTVEQAKAHHRERMMEGHLDDLKTVEFEIAWEERLAREAIKKEMREERFLEPSAKQLRERQEAEARWPMTPPVPEPTLTSPEYHFEDAAREAARDKTYAPPKELRGMSALLHRTLTQSKDGTRTTSIEEYQNLPTFQHALDRRSIGFARATAEDAERSHREAAFAKELGNYLPRFQEGEIVAIRAWDGIRRRQGGEIIPPGQRVYKLDQKTAKEFVSVLGTEKQLLGVEPTKKSLEIRAQNRTRDEAAKWHEIRFENATRKRGGARTMGNASVLASVGLTRKTGRIVGKSLDTVAGMFESLIAPVLTPEQAQQGERATRMREAEASDTIDLARFTSERATAPQQEIEKPREHDRDR